MKLNFVKIGSQRDNEYWNDTIRLVLKKTDIASHVLQLAEHLIQMLKRDAYRQTSGLVSNREKLSRLSVIELFK